MRLIFCDDPLDPQVVDPVYAKEMAVARELGIACSPINFEALVYERDGRAAVRRVEAREREEIGVYRGWMLRHEMYALLYEALIERGVRLINSPAAYRHCHHLPESYTAIEEHTARTIWLPWQSGVSLDESRLDEVMRRLETLGDRPLIVKDYVKSQKHRWAEACYIPSATNRATVARVTNRFLELQGEDLNEGLVFREYLEFEPLTVHSKSGMPLTKEYRLFYLDGEPILKVPYWEQGEYETDTLPMETFNRVASRIQSRFFTMDIAQVKAKQGEEHTYRIVELGDAQVAGLPERADPVTFYRALHALIDREKKL